MCPVTRGKQYSESLLFVFNVHIDFLTFHSNAKCPARIIMKPLGGMCHC